MRSLAAATSLVTLLAISGAGPARACGFGEAPGDCGQTPEAEARTMLRRVVIAVQSDEAAALQQFSRGENGFRTAETYVFCVGPDGIMSAHPDAKLRGTEVRDLHDSTGNRFIATMLGRAKAGEISSIRYRFPHPGGTREAPKHTFYTRAADQVCGVGVYDEMADSAAPPSPQARMAQLRERLSAGMPASLGSDWAAFQRAVDDDAAAKVAAFASVRDQMQAAEAVLLPPK